MKGAQADRFTDPALEEVVESGISAVRTFTINRRVSEVFQFSKSLASLRLVLTHLDAIQVVPDPFRITEEIADSRVAWAAKDGDDIFAYGTIDFLPKGDKTVVRMGMRYDVNKGKLREKFDEWFGGKLEDQILEDMRHLKQVMETGEVPTIEGQPQGHCGRV
jgi:uncharacterized membrane protein